MNEKNIFSKNNESINIKKTNESKIKFNSGRWKEEEHNKFIEAILEYGNEWKKVQKIIKTRSSTQARSHAQKFFLRIKKNLSLKKINYNYNDNVNDKNSTLSLINDNEKFSIKYFFNLLYGNEKKEKNKINGKISLEQKEKFLNFLSNFSNLNDNINKSNKKLGKNIKKDINEDQLINQVNNSNNKIFNISKEKNKKILNFNYKDNSYHFQNNEINSTISESDKKHFFGKKRKNQFDPFLIHFEIESNLKEKEYLYDCNEKDNTLFVEDNYLFGNEQRNRKGSDIFDNFIHL